MTRSALVSIGLAVLALHRAGSGAEQVGNLLRNPAFQDDWATHLPETKNHHWCYSSEYQNRRDYNPDGWWCKGSWRWLDADAPPGKRRLVLDPPGAEVTQRVNWVLVHDDRKTTSFPDAGGFPAIAPQRSRSPLRLVRDLTLRLELSGEALPADAGVVELALCPPGKNSTADPLGTATAPTVAATARIPSGTFGARIVEVKLPANEWLTAAQKRAQSAPKHEPGFPLPGTVRVAVRYKAATGRVELLRATLVASAPPSPNLMPHGGFEALDEDGSPQGWGRPTKYTYFPPRTYYLFNTWHNRGFGNRGPVAVGSLVAHRGRHSLKMIVAAGDEKAVASAPIALNQKEARLLEVSAWVKTDRLSTLQVDAVTEKGERLDGFNSVHKAPISIGTDDWRLVRQVFRPREPVRSVRLKLCARGVNGYTLDDTGLQPQNNVVGTIWWDGVRLWEPESSLEELAARGVEPPRAVEPTAGPTIAKLDLGEQKLGENFLSFILSAPQNGELRPQLELTSPSGRKSLFRPRQMPAEGRPVVIPYVLAEPCPDAYTEYRGVLSLIDGKGHVAGSAELWLGTWVTPIDLEIGAAYLLPEQRQLVRMNLGLSAAEMAKVSSIRLEVIRRRTGKSLKRWRVPATANAIAAQRRKIPKRLRGDFRGLLLTDLDVSFLPVQPFADPQRNWVVRATVLDRDGLPRRPWDPVDSAPFCRLAHEPPQPPIREVAVRNGCVHVNGKPWMPWGVIYGHMPVYDGPADPGQGQYLDLHNLRGWGYYDGYTSKPYTRRRNDFNCMRHFPGYSKVTDPKLPTKLGALWTDDNLYCATFFVVPTPGAFSPGELTARCGGEALRDKYLAFARTAPMVVATGPGIEESFGRFHAATPEQLRGMGEVVETLRKHTGKPVMISHGGYWNRFEFERVPYFDIFDPETEPWYPAQLHVDLLPLTRGKGKAIWLRPQMYEDVPYERWRYHVYVELMRGCRGWQIAHGPGDQSTFRGLHAEMAFMMPIACSTDPAPEVTVDPWLEHWVRRHDGKTYIVAATTRGLRLGRWRWDEAQRSPTGRSRLTDGRSTNEISFHGVQYLPDVRAVPAAAAPRLTQWTRLDPEAMPRGLAVLLKTDGRWRAVASWGELDVAPWRSDLKRATWFLRAFYRHADGFLGWGNEQVGKALDYIPAATVDMGPLPEGGRWTRLEVPLKRLGALGVPIDGVACAHVGGRVWWGRSSIAVSDGPEWVLMGESLVPPQAKLARTKTTVAGLKAGARVRVLFEDRELEAGEGFFVDDFRGRDLYQRFGGASGYGSQPVALHVYEIAQ